jgi:hypothetical protein
LRGVDEGRPGAPAACVVAEKRKDSLMVQPDRGNLDIGDRVSIHGRRLIV